MRLQPNSTQLPWLSLAQPMLQCTASQLIHPLSRFFPPLLSTSSTTPSSPCPVLLTHSPITMSVRLTSSPYLVVVTVGLVLLLLSCLSLAHGQSEPVVISSSNGRPVMALPLTVSTNLTWSTYGGNLANTHATSLSSDVIAASVTSWLDYTASPGTARPSGLVLTPLTVPALELKWSIPFTAPIVCSPAVDSEGNLYLAEYGGLQNLYKIDGATGDKIWAFNVSHIPQLINSTDGVRTTPALSPAEDVIVVGSQTVGLAYMMGFATANGSLLWITQLDTHPAAFITGSPSIDPTGQYVFASVSSNEESLVATQPGYVCCSFRGSVALLDVYTGSIVWQFYMIPANLTGVGLYSGAAVWGSSAPFDDEGVLVATGNLYDAPNATQQCVNDTLGTPAENDCVPDDIYQEVVLKLNVSNGEVMWAFHSTPYDAWTSLCGLNQALGGTKVRRSLSHTKCTHAASVACPGHVSIALAHVGLMLSCCPHTRVLATSHAVLPRAAVRGCSRSRLRPGPRSVRRSLLCYRTEEWAVLYARPLYGRRLLQPQRRSARCDGRLSVRQCGGARQLRLHD